MQMSHSVAELLGQSRQYADSGQTEKAADICQRILASDPDNAAAHFELGLIALKLKQLDASIRSFSRAIELDPSPWAFHHALGTAHIRSGNLAAAANSFRQAVTANPLGFEAWRDLGQVLLQGGDLASALEFLQRAIALRPGALDARLSLARTLDQLGRLKEAADLFGELVAARPDVPDLHYDLGVVTAKLGRFDEAIASYRNAIAARPDYGTAYNNLGTVLTAIGDREGAVACYRNALTYQPDDAQARSNLLMTLNYMPVPAREIYSEALQFEAQHGSRFLTSEPVFPNSRERDRVLKVGYVSSDFKIHSVAHFLRKLIAAHRRDRVEVFCYSNVSAPDEMTREIQERADHWVPIVGMPDEGVASRIRADQIDILVDLGGHTAANRLLVFARKPAPVQVAWLGYPNTTGMRAMDYRLTDAVADPPGVADELHTEKLVRLEHGFLCYQTDQFRPDLGEPPSLAQGHITYGSFNHFPKLTPDVVRLWSAILGQTPGSRLVLKARAMFHEQTRLRCAQEFARHGIGPDRMVMLELIPGHEEHLRAYRMVDIALDPFPYNGTTTTCEALWMGVPVITLRGDRHAARVGASILHRVGLTDMVARDEDEYVRLACALAGDTARLVTLRRGLRAKMLDSPLMNVALFTESLEDAYREMWRSWCG